jgi:hypothetical protein
MTLESGDQVRQAARDEQYGEWAVGQSYGERDEQYGERAVGQSYGDTDGVDDTEPLESRYGVIEAVAQMMDRFMVRGTNGPMQ